MPLQLWCLTRRSRHLRGLVAGDGTLALWLEYEVDGQRHVQLQHLTAHVLEQHENGWRWVVATELRRMRALARAVRSQAEQT